MPQATLCIHGTEDKYVTHEQAVCLIDRLKAAGMEAELLTLERSRTDSKDKMPRKPRLRCWPSSHLKQPK
jgi:hypothetical protein